MIKLLDRTTTANRATETIRNAILSGELAAGQTIRQEVLATSLGISRVPLREALRQLEGEGFVSSAPHRGVVVVDLSLDDLREISEVRLALETHVLRLAIPAHDAASLKRAQAAIDAIDEASDALERWGELNWRFHEALYLPANRPRTLELIRTYHAHSERYLRIHISVLKYKEKGQQEHRQLLRAVRERNVAKTIELMGKHVTNVDDMITKYLAKRRSTEE
ncbi:MAG: GntR family transcriptional regulator [Candidatus Eremiobacteraeota bacterium]|nr:GntR family transcriptional regulator [Candidatus Eremiobacteraeota bacterium]